MPGFRASTLRASMRALEDLNYSLVEADPQLSALIGSLRSSNRDPRRVSVLIAIQKSVAHQKRAIANILPRLSIIAETTLRNEVSRGSGVPVGGLEKYQSALDSLTSAIEGLSKEIGRLAELNKSSS
jgi:hypothetical protein